MVRSTRAQADEPREPERRRRATRVPGARAPLLDEGLRPLPAATGERAVSTSPSERERGYYDRPIIKAPVWTWEIPVYFFLGGTAGGLTLIAFAAQLGGGPDALVRAALWVASGLVVVAPLLLIADLKRPARFYNMLRVFKWRSPMSVGAWILTLYAPCVVVATLAHALSPWLVANLGVPAGALRALFWLTLAPAALLGTLLSTYTGVLLGATVVPAWSARRHLLPLHFGAASLGSAAALLELFFRLPSLWALGAVAALVETFVAIVLEGRRHGRRDAALREGTSGRLLRVAGLLSGPAALAFRLVGLLPLADVAFLVGALLSRFGWVAAGKASARDPSASYDEGPTPRARASAP